MPASVTESFGQSQTPKRTHTWDVGGTKLLTMNVLVCQELPVLRIESTGIQVWPPSLEISVVNGSWIAAALNAHREYVTIASLPWRSKVGETRYVGPPSTS
jgi:hypothetical protein